MNVSDVKWSGWGLFCDIITQDMAVQSGYNRSSDSNSNPEAHGWEAGVLSFQLRCSVLQNVHISGSKDRKYLSRPYEYVLRITPV
jgi:hypothetical protein